MDGNGPQEPRTQELIDRHRSAYNRLRDEQLIHGETRKPGESDETYKIRIDQEDQLAMLVAQGLCEIPEYTPDEKLKAEENARLYERGRARHFDDDNGGGLKTIRSVVEDLHGGGQ
jgi:hypothetical protein